MLNNRKTNVALIDLKKTVSNIKISLQWKQDRRLRVEKQCTFWRYKNILREIFRKHKKITTVINSAD